MPGAIRPNKKATKIAYAILKVPKDKQQNGQKSPSDRLLKEWAKDSSTAQ